jgi:hypothetical protein
MDDIVFRFAAWITALALALAMLFAWSGGRLLGRSVAGKRGKTLELEPALVSSKLNTYLALLGLLLGFTFSMSLTRHERRQSMVVADSNAISDFYACASLVKEPVRTNLLAAIREYARLHIQMARQTFDPAMWENGLQRNENLQVQMATLVSQAVSDNAALTLPLTSTLSEITGTSSLRLAAVEDRVPPTVVLLLFAFAIVTTALDGFEQGCRGNASVVEIVGILSFIVLVALSVYVILDLDQPGQGLITVSQSAMDRLVSSMGK